ncbi:MAG: hypothetical protein ACK5LC_02085 [Coprobacillaceae bacterium]
MNLELLKDKRLRYGSGVIILVILLLLLWSCDSLTGNILTPDKFIRTTKELTVKEKEAQADWNGLLNSTSFEDLCTETYATQFEELGERFISIYKEFQSLKVEGDKETVIPNYQEYLAYFHTFKLIGEELIEFADVVRQGKYQDALVVIDNLVTLNQQIPIIEW